MATITATVVCVFCVGLQGLVPTQASNLPKSQALSATVDSTDHSSKNRKQGRALIRQEDKMMKVEGSASTVGDVAYDDCTLDVELAKADNGGDGTPCTCRNDKEVGDVKALCRSASTKARVCTTVTEPTSPTCEAVCDGTNPADGRCMCEAVSGSTDAYNQCTSGQTCTNNTCQTPTPAPTPTPPPTRPACTQEVELPKADDGGAGTPCTCGTDVNGDDALCRSNSTKARVCTNATAAMSPTCEVICDVTTNSRTFVMRNTASCMCAAASGHAYSKCNSTQICNGQNTCWAPPACTDGVVSSSGCTCTNEGDEGATSKVCDSTSVCSTSTGTCSASSSS